MLVSMKEMLADARQNHYAIPAFDVSNYDMMKSVLEACEEERSPALLMALYRVCRCPGKNERSGSGKAAHLWQRRKTVKTHPPARPVDVFLCRCIQHIFDENAVAGGGVIHKNTGRRPHKHPRM